ncbi:MAG: OmpH family outer membrane protein [Bacteroidetes bacterium]|nr:OmpH family outer membrane protein [Bacteroidota bacterium]
MTTIRKFFNDVLITPTGSYTAFLVKCFIFTLFPVSNLLFAQKVAVVHVDSILLQMPSVQAAQKSAQDYLSQLENEVGKMQEEYNRKAEEFIKDSASYSPLIKDTKLKELNDLRQRISDFQVKAQQDYRNKQSELFKPVMDTVQKAIKKVAVAKGYSVVLDRSQGIVLYSSDAVDIYRDVIKELGLK